MAKEAVADAIWTPLSSHWSDPFEITDDWDGTPAEAYKGSSSLNPSNNVLTATAPAYNINPGFTFTYRGMTLDTNATDDIVGTAQATSTPDWDYFQREISPGVFVRGTGKHSSQCHTAAMGRRSMGAVRAATHGDVVEPAARRDVHRRAGHVSANAELARPYEHAGDRAGAIDGALHRRQRNRHLQSGKRIKWQENGRFVNVSVRKMCNKLSFNSAVIQKRHPFSP